MKKSMKKLVSKAVKNVQTIKGGGNGKGTKKASAQTQQANLELL